MNSNDENELQERIKALSGETEVPFWERPSISQKELAELKHRVNQAETRLAQLSECPEVPDDTIAVVCEGCGRQVGSLMDVDGMPLFWTGRIWQSQFDGICPCQHVLFWRKGDSEFGEIVARINSGNRGKCIKI